MDKLKVTFIEVGANIGKILIDIAAHALNELTAPGGEFVFNCYPLDDQGMVGWVRFHLVYKPLQAVLSLMPFAVIMFYARLMALLCLVPGLGMFLEKSGFYVMGDVPRLPAESTIGYMKRRFKSTSHNTFDGFGSHQYQHHKSNDEIRTLVKAMQPDMAKFANLDKYFMRPPSIGSALQVSR